MNSFIEKLHINIVAYKEFFMIKKINFLFILLLIALPLNVGAYSDYVIASGDNIGIKLNTDGIIVIGTYDIEGIDPATKAGLQIGDRIVSIDGKNVLSIEDISSVISQNSTGTIQIGYIRNGIEQSTVLTLQNKKTGLYLKDTISGIGTLTFVDPTTKIFGALGHEIVDSTSGKIVESGSGTIFTSIIRSITPSKDGIPGEKNASLNSSAVLGEIEENTNKGIFGTYSGTIDENNLYKVANIEDIQLGEATIKTVIEEDTVEEYTIKILKVQETPDNTKNIVFEITDSDLLEKTGGIIQGMSGSPIVQGEYIVGAVTHVVVDDPTKGYGILITNMLEEAEN